ncbi:hypothetical protein KI688_002271 [Linnemannia hyalina]|uniref:Uncharacterized protein n=1 Tax=Linnemannia hyalina TaxID=64524 RepID=A0A9P7XRN3_9FUNG|nr:hypothetical protein KI688_007703 [Linnemannia hyalina]KAG9065974.1 hypothetical protein KI688_002271 [Linnemannia hyalina]
MSHAPNPTAPDVDIDIYTTLRLMQEQMQQQQLLLQQQQARIQQLEAESVEQDGKVVCKPRATTLKLYEELLNIYPAIGEPKFFDSELPKNHDVFDWNDYHYTEGMDYKPPPVLQHSEVSLTDAAKRHERDLATIQGYLAHTTRFYDTLAHEIIKNKESDSAHGKRTLGFLNTVRISASHDASRISRMRENLYLDELGIKHGNDKEESLFTLESLAAKKAAADLVRKTYKKYEPPKDKTKKPDNKSIKDKSATDDTPKDQQSGKSQPKDKSGYRSDNGKSGYKSDGGKYGSKPRYKSGGSQGRKQPDQGNDGEESD